MAKDAAKPRPTVGIVVFDPTNGDVLYITKETYSGARYHELPQGGIEHWQKPLGAAYAELRQETGLKPEEVTFVTRHQKILSYTNHIGELEMRWFLFQLNADTPRSAASAERRTDKKENIVDVQWASLKSIQQIVDMFGLKSPAYMEMVSDFSKLINAKVAEHTAASRTVADQMEAMWEKHEQQKMAGSNF